MGSGILQPSTWAEIAMILKSLLPQFPHLRYFNVGGGLGIVERPDQQPLDLSTAGLMLADVKQQINQDLPLEKQIQFWMEPGRYLVAQCGVLLASVTQLKQKEDLFYVGNSLDLFYCFSSPTLA